MISPHNCISAAMELRMALQQLDAGLRPQVIALFAFLQVLHKATTLHFEFSSSGGGSGNAAAADGSSRALTTIHVPHLDSFTESEHQILAELVRRYNVPLSHRCGQCVVVPTCSYMSWPWLPSSIHMFLLGLLKLHLTVHVSVCLQV